MEMHQIKKCMVQMLILAGPGVLISTFCLGAALKLTFPYGWSWKTSFLLGGLLSATDPVSVVALLKEIETSKKLTTIIEGESLINDGSAIVVYQLFYQIVLGKSFGVGDIVKFLSQVLLGSVAVGLVFGITSVLWLGFILNDTVIEIALTLAVSYVTYFTAQDVADVSGVLTVTTLGMFYAAAKTVFKGDGQQTLHQFWEMVAYIANTLLLILSGVIITDGVLKNSCHFERHGTSWHYLILLYVFVQLSRVIVVGALYPFLRYFGYGLEWKEAIILVWSGLRGAVALSLSLSVNRASVDTGHSELKPEVGNLFVFFTGGIVFLTVIINGSTTKLFLLLLGMDKLSETKSHILNYARCEMLNKALEAFGNLGDDEELGPADLATVQRYITCFMDERQEQPHMVSESEHHLQATSLRDIRLCLLNSVQAAYWGMLEEGRISQNTASILMRSIHQAMDMVSSEPLCDWKGLKSNVHFPSYYKFLQMSRLPWRLVTYFTVERLETACYICAAFLHAHRIARRQLHDFIGDSEFASMVINESREEGEKAIKFLDDVRVTFPQVLHIVKTRQVMHSILKHLSDYVQKLEKIGLLEEKEMVHLVGAVQSDLKRLLRNPPLLKMPKVGDLLRTHPLLGTLPSAIRDRFTNSMMEVMKIRGVTLYKEGSTPNGVWLISVGVVKWASESLSNMHSLHPIFSHGSMLGLYEVLIGKPYICDIITDSVVHGFFLETDKIQSLLMSDPVIEDFLWQESATIIAKLLLPQKFEKMSMRELRGLVAEGSIMNIYIQGDVVEIRTNYVGFLLEGSIKTQDSHQDLLTSPSVLLPSHVDPNLSSLESTGVKNASLCHTGSQYQVVTRARVIILGISTAEVEPRRSQSKDHEGLPSRPENLFKAKHCESFNEANKQENSLSTKAFELSMVNYVRSQSRIFEKTFESATTHSLSYPRVPSRPSLAQPLFSFQSEGGSINGRIASKENTNGDSTFQTSTRGKAVLDEDNSRDKSGGDEVTLEIRGP